MVSIGTQYNKFSLAKREFSSFVPMVEGSDTYFAQRVIVSETSAFDADPTYGFVNVGTDATLIKGSNSSRDDLAITNKTGADLFIGTNIGIAASGTARGYVIPNNATFFPEVINSIYGILASGTGDVYYWEE